MKTILKRILMILLVFITLVLMSYFFNIEYGTRKSFYFSLFFFSLLIIFLDFLVNLKNGKLPVKFKKPLFIFSLILVFLTFLIPSLLKFAEFFNERLYLGFNFLFFTIFAFVFSLVLERRFKKVKESKKWKESKELRSFALLNLSLLLADYVIEDKFFQEAEESLRFLESKGYCTIINLSKKRYFLVVSNEHLKNIKSKIKIEELLIVQNFSDEEILEKYSKLLFK